MPDDQRIIDLLDAAAEGDRQAADALLPLVYDDLRRMAQSALAREAPGRTLQPTALVHEAWLRLVSNGDPGWESRRHFVGAAARAMRRILVDDARRRAARRPGPDSRRTELGDEHGTPATPDPDAVLDVDALLVDLERDDPRKAEVVHLRFFAGLSNDETARTLDISLATVEREWRFARALLARRLGGD